MKTDGYTEVNYTHAQTPTHTPPHTHTQVILAIYFIVCGT